MQQKIFISYSHQDYKCANGIMRFLSQRDYDVWIDTDRLAGGSVWAKDIDMALENADIVLSIISENSIRRQEVLRETDIALKRLAREGKEHFSVIFVVIGNIHPTWISNNNNERVHHIADYMQKVQFVQLDANASITLSSMKMLLRAIHGESFDNKSLVANRKNNYIFELGAPARMFDNEIDNYYYKLRVSDLSISTVFPFALDNQWLPDKVADQSSSLNTSFLRNGFAAEDVIQYVNDFQRKNLYLSLMHFKQVIINRASILNSYCLQSLYCDFLQNENEILVGESKAFKSLICQGAIVVFLYGDNAVTPNLKEKPGYKTQDRVIQSWNHFCEEVPVYCIRENWERPIDHHSIDFGKHCATLAFSAEQNELIAKSFGFDDIDCKKFYATLKAIDMTVFLQTHVLGTGHDSDVRGYSRSTFYKNFIVDESYGENAVLHCILDNKKPFCMQLKKIIDFYYNSIFVNYFNCLALFPIDLSARDTYLSRLYLKHGEKRVSADEIKYAFSEFFQNDECLEHIEHLGESALIDNWRLDDIFGYRQTNGWSEYVELLESLIQRSMTWKVDFSEISQLVSLFTNAIFEYSNDRNKCNSSKDHFVPAYSFRICIGSFVLDIVRTKKVKKIKQYRGAFDSEQENSISICFQIGDTTLEKNDGFIFLPVTIFDGKINSISSDKYLDELLNFFVYDCNFVSMS